MSASDLMSFSEISWASRKVTGVLPTSVMLAAILSLRGKKKKKKKKKKRTCEIEHKALNFQVDHQNENVKMDILLLADEGGPSLLADKNELNGGTIVLVLLGLGVNSRLYY